MYDYQFFYDMRDISTEEIKEHMDFASESWQYADYQQRCHLKCLKDSCVRELIRRKNEISN